ncbi:MAG: hypothetical protein VYB14_00700, partial [Planctomycetota bacterium]|nr:hypothetical protein [Planctomycetota bacterium]
AVILALCCLMEGKDRWLVGAVLLGVFWSSPELRSLAVSPDPRGLQLAFLYAGIGLVILPFQRFRGVSLGALAGLLVLTRPEGFLFASLLLGVALFQWKKKAAVSIGCFFAVVLPYLGLVSKSVGGVSLNSRAWEIKGSLLLEFLPVRPLIHLWGAGAESTPFREVLRDLGPQNAVPQENLWGALGAAGVELGASLLLVWWAAAAWGAVLIARSSRPLTALLGGTIVVSMALYWVPMGRDLALPLINLLPAVVALHFLAAWGLVDGLSRLRSRNRSGAFAGGAVALMIGLWGLHNGENRALPESFNGASSWMSENLPSEAEVASSLGSAPIVHQSHRRWMRIPSRWERSVEWKSAMNRPDFLVLSSTDGLWMLGPPRLNGLGVTVEPAAFFRDPKGWVLLLEFGKQTGAGQFNESGVVPEELEGLDSLQQLSRELEEGGADKDEAPLH